MTTAAADRSAWIKLQASLAALDARAAARHESTRTLIATEVGAIRSELRASERRLMGHITQHGGRIDRLEDAALEQGARADARRAAGETVVRGAGWIAQHAPAIVMALALLGFVSIDKVSAVLNEPTAAGAVAPFDTAMLRRELTSCG